MLKSNRAIDLTGREFSRLTVIEDTGRRSNKKIVWLCRCQCGNTTEVRSSHLIGGKIRSCGCLNIEEARRRAREVADNVVVVTHGLSSHRVYGVYQAMIARCDGAKTQAYERYGGRGIDVCRRWLGDGGFERFIEDMGVPGPDDTLERRDNDKDYSPENCRWATRKEQARNKRNTVRVEYLGEIKPLAEWAEQFGVKYKLAHKRLSKGWSLDKVFGREVQA